MIDLEADLAGMLNDREFGQVVTPAIGPAFEAVLDRSETRLDESGVGLIAVEQPTLTCTTSQAAGLAVGSSLTVAGQSFVVRGKRDDGAGLTVVDLGKEGT